MSEQESHPDWLPEGWTVEVRVRKFGRKDKSYADPSGELRFFSKPEVLRYLSNMAKDPVKSKEDTDSQEQTKEDSDSQKQSATNFVVEKVVAEGLPPGWTKEMRVKKKGRKIRRDPYYIDPTNKHVFRSMKEVFRYLENGESGGPAPKQKEEDCISMEECNEESSKIEAAEEKLADCETPSEVHENQSPALDAANDGDIPASGHRKEDATYSNRSISDMATGKSSVITGNLSETDGSVQGEEKDDSFDMAPEFGAPVEKLPSGNELQKNGPSGKMPSGIKSQSDDSATSEKLTYGNGGSPLEKPSVDGSGRTDCASSDKLLYGSESLKDEDAKTRRGSRKLKSRNTSDLPRRASKRLAGIKVDPPVELKTNHHPCRVATANQQPGEKASYEKQECSVVLPNEHTSTSEAQAKLVKSNNKKSDEKPELPLDLPSCSLWMDVDPCIDFAIKTLTGALPIDDNKADENPGIFQDVPGKSWEAPSNLPPEILWADPCIEFAVKTLTGEIPIQDYFQKPVVASRASRGQHGLGMPAAGLEHCPIANFPPQHLQAAERPPLYKQDAFIMPALPHAGNGILSRNPAGTVLYQHMGGRAGGYPRPTMI